MSISSIPKADKPRSLCRRMEIRDPPERRARLLWPHDQTRSSLVHLPGGPRDRLMVACQISSTALPLQGENRSRSHPSPSSIACCLRFWQQRRLYALTRLVWLRDRLPPMSRDASEQLEALYHNLGFWSRGFHLQACWQEYNRKSSGVERKRIRVYPASGDDELSLHPLCLGYPKPARPSLGRISATRAFIIRMCKPYGV